MDKIKNHSTSFFVDQLLNISLPKLPLYDDKFNKKIDLPILPINHPSTLSDSLSLINSMTYDRQTHPLNGNGAFIFRS